MPKYQETLVHRYWSHVFNNPEGTHVLLENPDTTPQVIPVMSGHGAHVVTVAPEPYLPTTWKESGRRVAEVVAFLRESGFKKGDRAAILSWNRAEWIWADLAIQSLGGVSVPIYPNSAAEQVNYLLADSGASFIFAEDDAQLAKVDASASIKRVVFAETKLSSVTPWSAITGAGKADSELARLEQELDSSPATFCGVSEDEPCTFIYTSGSTGMPKGVVLTHGNIAAECVSIARHGLTMTSDDVYLSYLPLAHVYERVNGQSMCIWYGVPTAFCRVDQVGDKLKLVRPTILLGVPAVWRKMKDKIQSQLDAATGLKGKLVRWAFAQKKPGFKRCIADFLVFRKIRAGLGGRLRVLMSGGAPISPEILNFFNQVDLNLLQGYGLTETAGGLSVNLQGRNKVGSVGQPIDVVNVRIVPEPGASESDSGEIWVRGDTVFRGYWNLPEETGKSITDDGWFKTGDLGKVDADGYLHITGRKKRLLKTDGGKYVAPEKLEKALDGDPIVQYVVPVGDGKPFISALVFVNELNARELLAKSGITLGSGTTVAEQYGKQPEVASVVNKAVEAALAAGNAKLEHWETMKKFKVVPVEASVGNGLLTATLKIRTEEVLKRYADLIEELYRK